MTPEQWNRVSDVLASAIDLDPAGRATLLEREEESIRREVERLLSAHQASGLLDRPIIGQIEFEKDLWTGKILNARYRIERFLARGGAGAVYVARDEQVAGRSVVVKFLERQDPWLKTKFREEMEALARIDHHGVVGILDAGETAGGLPFLVIEYIDGVTLRSEIQKGPMEIRRVARLIREIGGAVSAAHEKGILHRDLKPENIMLERAGTSSETVRLIDFGIARVDRPGQEALTQTTRFAGTTQYMAPEQLAGRPQASSDIYAIGVLAYEMLSGRRPFVAASPVELYEQQRAGVKTELHRLRPEIPSMAARVVLNQLSFKPENRSASAADAGEQIAAALEGRIKETWSRRRVSAVLAGGAAVAMAGAYEWSRLSAPLAPEERVVEVPIGTELSEHGFLKHLDIDFHVLYNADGSAFDSMRVWSNDQGLFYHPLSAAQARAAQRLGWRVTFDAAVEEGQICTIVDNPRWPARFCALLVRTPEQTDCAIALQNAAPVPIGIRRIFPGPAGARHTVVMSWNPSTDAELSVDGVKLVTGFRGEPNFRYPGGLVGFGASRDHSQRASGVFWKIRFEIG